MPDSSLNVLGLIAEHKEWLFSGIGVFFLSLLVTFFIFLLKGRKKSEFIQFQKSGKNSVNMQSRESITINGGIHNGSDSKDR